MISQRMSLLCPITMRILHPKSIFVLRNNDLGDVLVATPLLHGLRRAFPSAKICMGVGDWAKSLLENNPDLDQVLPCNAPWHNKQNCRFPANSVKTFAEGILYLLLSGETRRIASLKFTHGIDVLGSRQGSWLLARARVKHRFGVKGYAGGDTWCEDSVNFNEDRNVAGAALSFLPLLGSDIKVDTRPRIQLLKEELDKAEKEWTKHQIRGKRIVLAPGGGFTEKLWGDDRFSQLVKKLAEHRTYKFCILGSEEDRQRIQIPQNINGQSITNFCGKFSLRESAAMVSNADFVITNSSFCMHLAGSFKVPSITLLGKWYENADLHHTQWGYPEGLVLGKGDSRKSNGICSVDEAYDAILNIINK